MSLPIHKRGYRKYLISVLEVSLLYMVSLLEGYLAGLTLVSVMESTPISSILKRRLKTKLLDKMIILVLSTELDTRMDNVIVG